MKTNKKTARKTKKTVKKSGWFSGTLSRINNGRVMKKIKSAKDSIMNCVSSCVSWVDLNEHKIHSVLILGFGGMLLCPIIEPWTLVGLLALTVGVVRLLMRR